MPVHPDLIGPPKLVIGVFIYKPAPLAMEGIDPRLARFATGGLTGPTLEVALRHELGHAVGIPHHGDDVLDWKIQAGRSNVTPLLSPVLTEGGPPDYSIAPTIDALRALAPDALMVGPGLQCRQEDDDAVFREGKFAGCVTQTIVRRGQQNSGYDICPMRYAGSSGDFYEAPGSTAVFVQSGEVVEMGFNAYTGGLEERGRVYVDHWNGEFRRYKNEYERVRLERFCSSTTGTGLNAMPGDQNHAGDAGRSSGKPCRDYVVVNDVAARGVP
jgi:hypothetical protein